MKNGHYKFIITIFSIIIVYVSIYFSLNNLKESIQFFTKPSELTSDQILTSKVLKIGGFIKENSITKELSKINFIITDGKTELKVMYSGKTTNLFSENKPIIVIGKFENNTLYATKIISNHGNEYRAENSKI